ncbi:MAG: response regulator [Chloroflexi bacterium]|nr:response regulator [Chloroflexota bacterium]
MGEAASVLRDLLDQLAQLKNACDELGREVERSFWESVARDLPNRLHLRKPATREARLISGAAGRRQLPRRRRTHTTLPTTSESAPEPTAAQQRRRHILIVDDDHILCYVVIQALREEGHTVVAAPNGAAALAAVTHRAPDLILLDLRMPVMDGPEFVRAYRQLPHPRAPIITMTAATDARQWADQIGANGVLPKPFELADLFATVERVLHQ